MSQPQPTWDALIIGAGVVGLSAARRIAGEGGRVAVVERERISAGDPAVFWRPRLEVTC